MMERGDWTAEIYIYSKDRDELSSMRRDFMLLALDGGCRGEAFSEMYFPKDRYTVSSSEGAADFDVAQIDEIKPAGSGYGHCFHMRLANSTSPEPVMIAAILEKYAPECGLVYGSSSPSSERGVKEPWGDWDLVMNSTELLPCECSVFDEKFRDFRLDCDGDDLDSVKDGLKKYYSKADFGFEDGDDIRKIVDKGNAAIKEAGYDSALNLVDWSWGDIKWRKFLVDRRSGKENTLWDLRGPYTGDYRHLTMRKDCYKRFAALRRSKGEGRDENNDKGGK